MSSLFSNVDDDDATNFDESVLRVVGLLLFVSSTQRSKEWRPFRRRPKKQNFFLCIKKKTEERDKTEKEKSPNCLMYHYKKRGFKEKGYHNTHRRTCFFFWKK